MLACSQNTLASDDRVRDRPEDTSHINSSGKEVKTKMNRNDLRLMNRRKQILDAWRSLAPEATLNGMTLEQFVEATRTSEEVRQRIAETERTLDGLRHERLQSDTQLRVQIADLVDAVKGNPAFGANSPLYSAFGYVPRDARRSGLTRRGSATTPRSADAA